MARRNNSGSDGGINLDSLMDALTNVVAVLILVLLLVSVDAGRKVQQFIDDLKPATPEEVAAAKQNLEDLREREKQLEAKLKEEPPTPERIEEEKRQLALLEKSTEESKVKLADIAKLKELEIKVRAELDAESKQTVAIQEEIAKLEALLDETPMIKPDTPTVVNIPNSRPIPNDARIFNAMAKNGRIHIIDPYTPMEMFEEEFKKHRKEWLIERIKAKGADRYIYDGQKIAAYFKTFDWKNTRGQKIEVRASPTSTRMVLVISPDLAKGGTATEDLAKVGSGYSKAATVISRDFKAVLLFRVSPESFNTYLAARELADKANIPSGWEVNGGGEYWIRIDDVEIKRLEDPPPPPPDAKPAPPGPPKLKPKLD